MDTVTTLLPVFFVVLVLLGLGVLAMAVGVMFKRPCLRGSCGGTPPLGPTGQALRCATCPGASSAAPGQSPLGGTHLVP